MAKLGHIAATSGKLSGMGAGARGRLRAGTAAVALTGAALLLVSPGARAATQIGETFPTTLVNCTGATAVQVASPGPQYSVPFDGVITSWSHHANADPTQLRFKVARQADPNTFAIVGQSSFKTPVPSQLNVFTEIQIPVRAGDVIGMYMQQGSSCGRQPPGQWQYRSAIGDVQPGGSLSNLGTTVQFNLAATVEPDCDSDGLGDETQDSDLTSCDHSAPDTAITAGPNSRTKKKRAKFEFSGSDARAVAGFQCSVDGAEFNACASPFTVRVKMGRHTFSVSAVDANGNVDAAPAADAWKVKKKKKK